MCSGDRSNSANGAIAFRQSAAISWSTSSSSVLSDCTMRGPSFTARVYGLGAGLQRADRGDPVDGEPAYVVGAVVVGGELATLDGQRVDDAVGGGAVVVDVPDQHRGAVLDRVSQRGQRPTRAERGRGCGARRGRALAGADRGDRRG